MKIGGKPDPSKAWAGCLAIFELVMMMCHIPSKKLFN